MKICICSTPIRPIPSGFPPFGSMAIIQSLELNFRIYLIPSLKLTPLEINPNYFLRLLFLIIKNWHTQGLNKKILLQQYFISKDALTKCKWKKD